MSRAIRLVERYNRYANKDPHIITAKYPTKCAETGKTIKKGEECIYYPIGKKCFSMDSKQAKDFRSWQMDLAMGHNY